MNNCFFSLKCEKAGLKKWKEKLVFFCADGAAVNMGKKTGAAAKLKEEIGHLLSIHCVAHRLELGMVDAIKAQPGSCSIDTSPKFYVIQNNLSRYEIKRFMLYFMMNTSSSIFLSTL